MLQITIRSKKKLLAKIEMDTYQKFGACWFPCSDEKFGGRAPNRTSCGGIGGNPTPCGGDEAWPVGDEAGTTGAGAGEDVGAAGEGEEDGRAGGADWKADGGAGGAGGEGESAVFIPRRLRPRPFSPLPRRPKLAPESMALDLEAAGGEDEGGAHDWEREEGAHGKEMKQRAGRGKQKSRALAGGIARAAVGRIGSSRVEHGIGDETLLPSMRVSYSYREVGNRACECRGHETNLFSLLTISCKNSFCADVSP